MASTRWAARSVIRRPPQLGHHARPLHENGTRCSRAQPSDGNRVELYCDNFADGGFKAMQRLRPKRAVMDIETGEAQRR